MKHHYNRIRNIDSIKGLLLHFYILTLAYCTSVNPTLIRYKSRKYRSNVIAARKWTKDNYTDTFHMVHISSEYYLRDYYLPGYNVSNLIAILFIFFLSLLFI